MKRPWGVLVLAISVVTMCAATASPQPVEMDPLQCWWRTSAPAVRVGEPFVIVLTCSVIENDAITVVPDESPLDPTAMQMPPFEVLGGTHHADLRADDHRFLQYDYRLRVIGEDLFGKDVKLPDYKISYRVRSNINGSAIEGIEKAYFLPALSVRVLSLVPADATDIRDATSSTFGDIETRAFRANVLNTVAGVLFTLAGLTAVLALAGVARRYRRPRVAGDRLIRDAAILRGVRSELAAIGRERGSVGWTPALAGRLLTVLRILAGYALSRPVSQAVAVPGDNAHDGALIVRGGWTRGKKVVVSGFVTPHTVTTALAALSTSVSADTPHALSLTELEPALARLTSGRYGREVANDQVLDDALEVGLRVVRRLRIEETWPVRTFRAARRAGTELGQRVWSH